MWYDESILLHLFVWYFIVFPNPCLMMILSKQFTINVISPVDDDDDVSSVQPNIVSLPMLKNGNIGFAASGDVQCGKKKPVPCPFIQLVYACAIACVALNMHIIALQYNCCLIFIIVTSKRPYNIMYDNNHQRPDDNGPNFKRFKKVCHCAHEARISYS